LGTGLLAGGVALGALSRRDHRAYKQSDIGTYEDVDYADELLERARDRARLANVLLISGAAVSAAGVVTLLWSYLQPRSEQRKMALQLAPERSGMSLSLNGAWQGGL
jgi:hypothetical protein